MDCSPVCFRSREVVRRSFDALARVFRQKTWSPGRAVTVAEMFSAWWRRSEADVSKSYRFERRRGPWLILAHTFSVRSQGARPIGWFSNCGQDLNLAGVRLREDFDFSVRSNTGAEPIQQSGWRGTVRRGRMKIIK